MQNILSGWTDVSSPPSPVEGPVRIPPIDHSPDYFAKGVIQGDNLLTNWLSHITITSEFGIHSLPGPSAPCCQQDICSTKGWIHVSPMCFREGERLRGRVWRLRVLPLFLQLIVRLGQGECSYGGWVWPCDCYPWVWGLTSTTAHCVLLHI